MAKQELWPLRLAPYPDELFSSWFVRLARQYEMTPETFCHAVWPGRNPWRDMDRQIDDESLELLSRKAGISFAQLFSMTLRSHEEQASPGDEQAARDLYFRDPRTDQAIRYCPGCLAGPDPYFRMEWRLAFVTMCPCHGILLCERCSSCRAACLFANLDTHASLTSCHRCRRSLLYVDSRNPQPNEQQAIAHVQFQEDLLTMFGRRKGYRRVADAQARREGQKLPVLENEVSKLGQAMAVLTMARFCPSMSMAPVLSIV